MTATPIQRRDFYVYALFREDGETPFYIGMGRKDRWLHHERRAIANRSHKDRIILKMRLSGLPVPKTKVSECLTRIEAAQLEIDLILLVGRSPQGPLTNRTAGGEGLFDPSPEVRKRMSDKRRARPPMSEESRKKTSKSLIGRRYGPRSPEMKLRLSLAVRGFKHTQEAIEKIAARSRLQKLTPEHKEKLRQSRLGTKHTAAARDKIRIASTGRIKSDEEKAKHREAILGQKRTQDSIQKMKLAQSNRTAETRARISSAAKTRWGDNATIERHRSAAKNQWKDPAIRAKNIAGLKAAWARRKAAQNVLPSAMPH